MSLKHTLLKSLSLLAQPLYGGLGHILMFHRVTDTPPTRVPGQSQLEISPERLEEIVQFFQARDYDFIDLDRLPARLETGRSHKKFVVFTFDDGYADNLTHAYPILRRYKVPFTIYVATSFPDHTAVLWWYLLDDLILTHDRLRFDLPEGLVTLDCSTPENRIAASRTLRAHIKYGPADTFDQLMQYFFSPYGIDLYSKTRELSLSWSQIEQLDRDPLVTIGSHSMHHFPLSVLSQQQAKDEIKGSKDILEECLGHPVNHFAYPFGERREATPRDFALVRQAGYHTAVTTRFANLFADHQAHLQCLPRFDAPALGDDQFELACNGLLQVRRNRFRRIICE